MKKNLLIVLLCVLSVGAFAQKGKAPAKKTTGTATKKTAATPARKPTGTAAKKGAGTTGKKTVGNAKPVAPKGGAGGTGNGAAGQLPQQAQTGADTTKVAQLPTRPFERPLDGYFKKSSILTAKATPYQPLREADVAMLKRVWEEIDIREKMNTYMGSPKARLIDVFMNAIAAGELTAYDPTPNPNPVDNDPDGDSFSRALKPGEAKMRLAGDSTPVQIRDKDNNIVKSTMVAAEFVADSIVRFRIKEDWIFDKQRSVWEPRIIGIAPLYKPSGAAGIVDYTPAFWIYFPDARQILATKEVVVKDNDATGLSYDDVFMKRIFTAYIVKASNNKNERIKDYTQGIDKLYEAQRIKKELMNWELDLWQY
jgi:gliding motility associated protien GldN